MHRDSHHRPGPSRHAVGRPARVSVALAMLASALCGVAAPAGARVARWGSAVSGNWSDHTRWSTGQAPLAGDTVMIDVPGTYTLTMTGTVAVSSVKLGAASGQQVLKLNGTTRLDVSGSFVVYAHGVLQLVTNTLVDGTGTLTSYGTIRAERQTNEIGKPLNLQPGSLLHIAPNTAYEAQVVLYGTAVNHGTVEFGQDAGGSQSGSRLSMVNGAFVNASDGTIAFLGPGGPLGTRVVAGALQNQGRITVAGASRFEAAGVGVWNAGTLLVDATTLTVNFGTTAGGTFTNAGGATVGEANGATIAFTSSGAGSGQVLNAGTWDATGGSVSSVQTAGSVVSNAGTLQFGDGRTFAVTGGRTLLTPGSLGGPGGRLMLSGSTLTGGVTLDAGTPVLTLQTGNVVDAVHLLSGGQLLVQGATNTLAHLDLPAGARLHLGSAGTAEAQLALSGDLANHGTIELGRDAATGTFGSRLTLTGGTLTNADDGTILFLAGAAPGGARTLVAPLVNRGRVTSSAGGAVTGGPFVNDTTGTIEGDGSLDLGSVAFTNDGTIAPGNPYGALALTTATPFSAAGRLLVRAGGADAAQAGRLDLAGAASLRGRLVLETDAGYLPAAGDSLVALTFGSRSGRLLFPDRALPNGFEWSWRYASDRIVVTAGLPLPNLPPVALGDTVFVPEDSTVTFAPAAHDYDPEGDVVAFVGVPGPPAHGTAEVTADGHLLYRPEHDFNGIDTVRYVAGDAHGGVATGEARVHVLQVPDPPFFLPPTPAADTVFHVVPGDTVRLAVCIGAALNETAVFDGPWIFWWMPGGYISGNPVCTSTSWVPTQWDIGTLPVVLRATTNTVAERRFSIVVEAPTPALVERFDCSASDAGVDLAWALAPGNAVTSALVERAEDRDGAWTVPEGVTVGEDAGGGHAHDGSAEPGRDYLFRVTLQLTTGGSVVLGPAPVTTPAGVREVWLSSPSPNPGSGHLSVEFALVHEGRARLYVVDVQGREVARPVDGVRPAGRHRLEWQGASLAPGLYFLRFEAGGVTRVRRWVVSR
jgi:hypothetical protein